MIDISILKTLEPISTLSPNRIQELSTLSFSEKVSKGIDPFRINVVKNAQVMYLLKGQLELRFGNGTKTILTSNSEQAKSPIDLNRLDLIKVHAISEIEILRLDMDLLDIMMTWDQIATIRSEDKQDQLALNELKDSLKVGYWMTDTGAFSINKLQTGLLSRLPTANIEEMFKRMTAIDVIAGQEIIRQGTEGDYYYLINSGVASVTHNVNGSVEKIATLLEGDSFGEEALVSDNKRNATITMQTSGILLKLNKFDFVELLKAPLITQVSLAEAKKYVLAGAIFIDVRNPSEYKISHLPEAINIPLKQIRTQLRHLDVKKQYLTFCQTGRRSSAAAFIMIQNGFDVCCIKGNSLIS